MDKNRNEVLLSEKVMLRFQFLPPGFPAAFKNWPGIPRLIEKYALVEPRRFIIIQRDKPWPELGIDYFAAVTLDEDHPKWSIGDETFYRCITYSRTLLRANEESVLKILNNPTPGRIIRSFRVIPGGKK